MLLSLRKSWVGRVNNVRSREGALWLSLLPHFIILGCHGDELYITVSFSLHVPTEFTIFSRTHFPFPFPFFPHRGQQSTTS